MPTDPSDKLAAILALIFKPADAPDPVTEKPDDKDPDLEQVSTEPEDPLRALARHLFHQKN